MSWQESSSPAQKAFTSTFVKNFSKCPMAQIRTFVMQHLPQKLSSAIISTPLTMELYKLIEVSAYLADNIHRQVSTKLTSPLTSQTSLLSISRNLPPSNLLSP